MLQFYGEQTAAISRPKASFSISDSDSATEFLSTSDMTVHKYVTA